MGKLGIVIIIIIVVAVGGIFVLGSGGDNTLPTEVAQGRAENTEGTEQFNKVPQFAFEDNKGNEVTPNDFPGKILVVNSWATWCPFCVDELPDFVELQKNFADDIVVIAIDRAESRSTAVGYTDGLGVTDDLVWLLDPSDSFYRSIGGFSMPETLFVDSEGNIRIHKRGPMDIKEMTEKVTSILEQSD